MNPLFDRFKAFFPSSNGDNMGHIPIVTPRKPAAGWRHFRCEECGREWKSTTRDHESPSGDDCACCGAWVHPADHWADEKLETDESGNLLYYETRVTAPGQPETD